MRVGIGHDHRDRERGADGARGEPLVAVDDPLAVHQLGARLKAGRVGARDGGLGHRKARAGLAIEERLEPLFLLLWRAVLGEDLHVAGVRRGAVERHRRDRGRAAHLLAQDAVLPVGEPGAELVVGQEKVPKAVGLRLLAKLADDGRVGDARAGAHLVVERLHRLELDRQHLRVDERSDALREVNDAGAEIEVHGPQPIAACGKSARPCRSRASSYRRGGARPGPPWRRKAAPRR